jgi:2-succinyl-5-enolpyruvyl-6-hydroxy-3-cyclohexene-1-carboxylate synthase
VAAFDGLLRTPAFADDVASSVETVLRLGEPPASKVLTQWLAGLDGADSIVVDPYGRWPDPERRADRIVHADPTSFCSELMDAVHAAPEGWLAPWLAAEGRAQAAIDGVLAGRSEATEPGVARLLTSPAVGEDVTLFVSSSMPIRDVEWFGHPSSAHRVLANRGANGIDGIVSTALGAGVGGPCVALVGDLAFLYDAGGLLGAAGRSTSCTFVVLDNGGGGIFSFLPQASALGAERFEQLFGTPQTADLPALCAAYGVPVTEVAAAAAVAAAVAEGVAAGGVRVVVVRTPGRAANVTLHDELHAAIAAALS